MKMEVNGEVLARKGEWNNVTSISSNSNRKWDKKHKQWTKLRVQGINCQGGRRQVGMWPSHRRQEDKVPSSSMSSVVLEIMKHSHHLFRSRIQESERQKQSLKEATIYLPTWSRRRWGSRRCSWPAPCMLDGAWQIWGWQEELGDCLIQGLWWIT